MMLSNGNSDGSMVGTLIPKRPGFREVLGAMGNAQKPGLGVPAYTRWLNRRGARVLAAGAVVLGLRPNTVSVLSAAVSACALLLLMIGPASWGLGICVAALLAVGYMLDSADGQVARVTSTGSPAGEWLDHVIDAVRTPALHLAVLVGFYLWFDVTPGWYVVPMLFVLLGVGHFMSQILAEQLVRQYTPSARGRRVRIDEDIVPEMGPGAGALRSVLLLPIDTGTLCWIFVFWGNQALFITAYCTLLVINFVFAVVSAGRKYRSLVGVTP